MNGKLKERAILAGLRLGKSYLANTRECQGLPGVVLTDIVDWRVNIRYNNDRELILNPSLTIKERRGAKNMGANGIGMAGHSDDLKKHGRNYDRPLAVADTALMTVEDDVLKVLLVKRGEEPFVGQWALPGVMVRPDLDEDLRAAALRALMDKATVSAPYVEQLEAFSGKERDPRGWSASYAHVCLLPREKIKLKAGRGTEEAKFFPLDEAMGMDLAFDHNKILKAAAMRVRNKVSYSSLPAQLMPDSFTITELQKMYEVILGQELDKSAFRKKIAETEFIRPIEGEFRHGANRPAQLYEIDREEPLAVFRRTLTP